MIWFYDVKKLEEGNHEGIMDENFGLIKMDWNNGKIVFSYLIKFNRYGVKKVKH